MRKRAKQSASLTTKCDVYTSFVKQSKTQEVQANRGFFDGTSCPLSKALTMPCRGEMSVDICRPRVDRAQCSPCIVREVQIVRDQEKT